jgi:predicted RNA-binding Zn-ribbon protein involved in translation (DUF1610 family)
MIVESQAKVLGEVTEVATKVEIYCPNCGRDVDEGELAAKKCNDCNTDLSTPEQHVAVAVTSVPAFAITF